MVVGAGATGAHPPRAGLAAMSSTEPSVSHAAPALGEPAVTMRGITKRFPGVARERPGRLRGARRRGARPARRERRRQEHPVQHPHRPLPRRRGRARALRAAGRLPVAARCARRRDRDGAPALPARGAVHRGRERRPRRSPRPRPLVPAPLARDRAARGRARRALRDRRRAARANLAALGRRAAAGGDPQGALPRGARPDPRRADGGADAAGGRGAVRHPALDGRRGAHDHLHLAQAARGDGRRRPRHRAARRPLDRHRRHRRCRPRSRSPR